MSAQVVFDCDDLKKEIFSFCLPQYPVITKKMIDGLPIYPKNQFIMQIKALGKYCFSDEESLERLSYYRTFPNFVEYITKPVNFLWTDRYAKLFPELWTDSDEDSGDEDL